MEVQTWNKNFWISFKHDSTHLIWAMSLLVVKIKLLTFRDSAFIASRTGTMASVVAATIFRAEQSEEKSRMMSDGTIPLWNRQCERQKYVLHLTLFFSCLDFPTLHQQLIQGRLKEFVEGRARMWAPHQCCCRSPLLVKVCSSPRFCCSSHLGDLKC